MIQLPIVLAVDSPFFPAIVIFKNQPFPQYFGGFPESRIPGKNGTEGTPRIVQTSDCPPGFAFGRL